MHASKTGCARSEILVNEAKPARKPGACSDRPSPELSPRPWFFSLLPAADIKRTEVGLNTAQRRFTGLIRFIEGLTLSSKDASAAGGPSHNLLIAARSGDVDCVRRSVAAHADINHASDGMTAIMYAAQNGDLEMTKALIAAGCGVNKNNMEGKAALMLAAEKGHVDVVNYLINWGADVTTTDGKGLTALALAARSGQAAVLQSFIDAGVAIDEPMMNGSTVLMHAAQAGHVEFVRALIAEGADCNKSHAKSGRTALMYAASERHTDIVKVLLANKASVDAKGELGSTALMMAAQEGHADVVKALLANKASVDAKDKHGQTALMIAAFERHTDVVEVLLAHKASVDAKNAKGQTALMAAAYQGHTKVVELLLANNASVDAKNAKGQTALIYAAMNGRYATLTSLIEGCANQYEALLSGLHHSPDLTKVIVRAWLNSTKNKLDAVTALCCVFASGPDLQGPAPFDKADAISTLAASGLALTQEDFNRIELTVNLSIEARSYLKAIFIDGAIPWTARVANAYWSGNHALVDEVAYVPYSTIINPLGVQLSPGIEDFNPDHCTDGNGAYLHAVGRLHDRSPKMDWSCDMDPMTAAGWRSKVTVLLRGARNAATEASQQISSLLAAPEMGLALKDELGQPVAANNIRLKDTLFALELERNEPLNQIAEPPKPLPPAKFLIRAQKNHQQAREAQAEAILASNKTYKRLKLRMPALDQAKDIEKKVRSGLVSGPDAAVELDELLAKTEQMLFEAPGMASELAYHWFISEVAEVCQDLKEMGDKFRSLTPLS